MGEAHTQRSRPTRPGFEPQVVDPSALAADLPDIQMFVCPMGMQVLSIYIKSLSDAKLY